MPLVRCGSSGLAVALFILPSLLAGQDEAVRQPGDSAYRLPGISVSVTRHDSYPLAVPFAFTRLNGAEFRTGRGLGIDEALSSIPGVLAQSRYGGSDIRLVIRGYGARGAGDRSNAGTSRGIRILLDGFPETEPDGRTSFDGVDLASAVQIEVIRSNATTLFGNAAGGVVSISTLPDFEHAFGEAEFVIGGFGLRRSVLRAGHTAGNARIAGTGVHTTSDGWRANSESERTLVNTSISVPMGPSGTLRVHVMGVSNRFQIPGPLTQAQVDADPSQANPTYAVRHERRYNRLGRLGVTAEQDIAEGRGGNLAVSAYVNPKFLQRSERGTFRDFTRYHVGGNVLYRLSGPIGGRARAGLIAGLDEGYQDGAILFYSLTADGNRGPQLRDNKREGANNLGSFLQGELGLGDKWSFTLGGRYDRVTYYSESFINPGLRGTRVFGKLTPRAGINFRMRPGHSIYTNVGGGVEVPAGNETDPASTFGQDTVYAINPLLDPIVSRTYELGTKHVFTPDGGILTDLSYDLALYHIRVKDDIIPYRGGRFYFTAGRTHRTGAELGLTARTRYGVFLSAALTLSHNRYAEYVVDSIHYGRPGQTADYSGNAMIGVPAWVSHGTIGLAPHGWHGVRVQMEVHGESRYFLDDANRTSTPGYAIVSATVTLDQQVRLGALSLQGHLRVNNLLDRRYIASAFLNPDMVNGVPVAFEPGLPRHIVVGAAVRWR